MINVIFLLLMFFLIAGNLKPLFRAEQELPRSRSEALAGAAQAELALAIDGAAEREIVAGRSGVDALVEVEEEALLLHLVMRRGDRPPSRRPRASPAPG